MPAAIPFLRTDHFGQPLEQSALSRKFEKHCRPPLDIIEDLSAIRLGQVSQKEIVNLALRDPAKLESLVDKGLPLDKYPGLMKQVISSGRGATNLDSTLRVLKKGGLEVGWNEVRTAATTLGPEGFMTVLKNGPALSNRQDARNLSDCIQGNPTLAGVVKDSALVSQIRPQLAFELAAARGDTPVSQGRPEGSGPDFFPHFRSPTSSGPELI